MTDNAQFLPLFRLPDATDVGGAEQLRAGASPAISSDGVNICRIHGVGVVWDSSGGGGVAGGSGNDATSTFSSLRAIALARMTGVLIHSTLRCKAAF